MRVFMHYARHDIDLGEMPVLPLPEDRIKVTIPAELRQDADEEYLTVGRRIFEQRRKPAPISLLNELPPILMAFEWVCVLMPREVQG